MPFDLTYSEEQEALSQTARDFTKKEITPVAGHLDEEGKFPTDICKKAWETGLMHIEVVERRRWIIGGEW